MDKVAAERKPVPTNRSPALRENDVVFVLIVGLERDARAAPGKIGACFSQARSERLTEAGPVADRKIRDRSAMVDRDEERLDRQFERLERNLPGSIGRSVRWLRQPSSRWVRIPAAVLLIVGGLFGFLPILGLWMVPLGLLLLAQDLPFLRRPTGRALTWLERQWAEWQGRRRRGRS
jgi:hypothetical protein